MARKVECLNKGLFSSMKEFELKPRSNGKTTLGTGSFGAVHLYNHIKTSTLYAVKSIQSANIQTPYEVEGIEREIKVHGKSSHPNIVQLHDSFQENGTVYLILEYIENGNLYNYVQKKKKLDEKEACKYFVQTCKALQSLHENNVFHRDIKPENLLLDVNHDLKLCDFGWCAENIHLKRKTFCGTYEYMAPEIVSDISYDYTIDIWSCGVLLYELLHGYAPFKGKEYKDIQAAIKANQIRFSSSVSEDAQNLIKAILQKDPQSRLSYKQIFSSPFVQRCYPSALLNLKVNISPRSSFSMENIQKYQSPVIQNKNQGRIQYLNTSSSLKSPSLSKSKLDSKRNIFEDVRKKMLFENTSPLKDSTNLRSKKQPSLTQLFTKSSKREIAPPLSKLVSKTKHHDENTHHSRLLEQFKSMPSITHEDQFYHVDTQDIKTDRVKQLKKQDQQHDLDRILKMYLGMCSSRQ